MHPHKVWGKLHDGAAWFLMQNLLWLLHFIANSELSASMDWVQSWIYFVIEFFHWFYTTSAWTWRHHRCL